jgi:uncharacterized membrane protein YkoI
MARANRVRAKLEKAMSPLERQSTLPQLAAEQAEALKLVWQELQAMPEDSRALVVLCYQEGLSISDAAEALDIPRETLRDRLAASMAELRKKLSQRGVMLSLLAIAGLLKHGSAEAAPIGLCEALDVALPGQPCAEIPAAKAPAAAPELASSTSTLSPQSFSKTIGLGIAASLLIGAGIWFVLDAATAPQSRTVATAPNSSTRNRRSENDNQTHAIPASTNADPKPDPTAIAVKLQALEKLAPTRDAAKKDENHKVDFIPLRDVPSAARDAANRAVAGVKLFSAELNREEKELRYEFKGDAGGKTYEIIVSTEGKIISVKLDDDQNPEEKPVLPPAPPKADF